MKKILAITTAAILISGCGGGAPNKVTNELPDEPVITPKPATEPEPEPEPENKAPTISGTPASTLFTNTDYLFTPNARDADEDPLTFSITNKPIWAEFDTLTGVLKGKPTQAASFKNILISVSDEFSFTELSTFSIVVTDNNQAPIIFNQTLEAMESTELMITLGPDADTDGDSIQYSFTDSQNTTQGPNANQIFYNNALIEVEEIQITASDNINAPVNATISITTSPSSPSNYVTTRDTITPDYGLEAPKKGESIIDPTTGTRITRLTDASELSGTTDALIVYSRYTPENTKGDYFLTFGEDSSTSWLIERITGDVIIKLTHEDINGRNRDIGESHEIRWDLSGNNHNRIYYRYGMSFYMVEDITELPIKHKLIKDFSLDVPNATKIFNDVEGDSSNNSDHWAFMAAHYDGSNYIIDAFIHYQMPNDINEDKTHIMTAANLTGSALNHYAETNQMPRPNMIEINPTGTGVVLHFGRSWISGEQSNRIEDMGTYFDGPHLWPFDFNYTANPPVKISVSETHAGWAWDDTGREMFISQNNTTDKLDAVYTYGENSGYEHKTEIASHSDFGWSNGFHYGKMPSDKKGWAFINTYSTTSSSSHHTDWGADQFVMLKIEDESNIPTIWRIAPNYNIFSGNYRDEAPAAINTFGNRIYVSSNWGGLLPNREVFVFELPSNWNSILDDL